MTTCTTQGALAGTAVVAADGVPIAGWYIPAANGAAASATTASPWSWAIAATASAVARLSGVAQGITPAAISLLLIHLKRGRFSGFATEDTQVAV